MKYRSIIFALLLLSVGLTSCWELLGYDSDPCTECQSAMDHLASALNSGSVGCTWGEYNRAKAYRDVTYKCNNGKAKAFAIVEASCGGGGSIPPACE